MSADETLDGAQSWIKVLRLRNLTLSPNEMADIADLLTDLETALLAATDLAKQLTVRLEAAEAERKSSAVFLQYLLGDRSQVHPMFGGLPNVRDLCFTAWSAAKGPNGENGGPSDWFNDALPIVERGITKMSEETFRK